MSSETGSFGRAEGTAPINPEIPVYGGRWRLFLKATEPVPSCGSASNSAVPSVEMIRLRLQCCMVARVLNMYKTGTRPRAATFLPSQAIQIMQVRIIPA
jgi:hypothetical protein